MNRWFFCLLLLSCTFFSSLHAHTGRFPLNNNFNLNNSVHPSSRLDLGLDLHFLTANAGYDYRSGNGKEHAFTLGIGFIHTSDVDGIFELILTLTRVNFRLAHDYNYIYVKANNSHGIVQNISGSVAAISVNLRNELSVLPHSRMVYSFTPQLGANIGIFSIYAGPKLNLARPNGFPKTQFQLSLNLCIPFYEF